MSIIAKDGTLRGNTPGNPRNAGRKRKPLADRITEGQVDPPMISESARDYTDLDEPEELEAEDIAPFDGFMSAPQRVGIELCAKDVAHSTMRWLRERGCANLVNPIQVKEYAMCIARWIQCEMLVSEKGFLAKHPTTQAPMTSPYLSAGLNFMRQANAIWGMIFQVVRDNSTVSVSGITPQDEAMERLLQMKNIRQR